jgi:hypothetical protein
VYSHATYCWWQHSSCVLTCYLLLVTAQFMGLCFRPKSAANPAPPSARNVELQSLDFYFTFSHYHDLAPPCPTPTTTPSLIKTHSLARHSESLPIMLQMRMPTLAWNSKREKTEASCKMVDWVRGYGATTLSHLGL